MQPTAAKQTRFLDQVRLVCRRSHFSPRTEEAYIFWIRRFILFRGKRHPSEMYKTEVVAFLNHLAGPRQVSASTQSQALNALLFLYKRVLETDPGWFDGLTRVQRKKSLPVVLSEGEVLRVLSAMSGTPRLMAQLLYGAGLRVMEWVKDFDVDRGTIVVRSGKGNKDRVTLLPKICREALQGQPLRVSELHTRDRLAGAGYAPMPDALYRKYPSTARSLGWQYAFPSAALRHWPALQATVTLMRPNTIDSCCGICFDSVRSMGEGEIGIMPPALKRPTLSTISHFRLFENHLIPGVC